MPDYLEHRIQTILVNSQAIDDVQQIPISGGDVIALSAAMPGLAGTTLRKGSHLSEMRRAITHPSQPGNSDQTGRGQEEVVTLKLFNLVAREIGPAILDGRFMLKEKDLNHLLAHTPNLLPTIPVVTNEEWVEIRLETPAPDSMDGPE